MISAGFRQNYLKWPEESKEKIYHVKSDAHKMIFFLLNRVSSFSQKESPNTRPNIWQSANQNKFQMKIPLTVEISNHASLKT